MNYEVIGWIIIGFLLVIFFIWMIIYLTGCTHVWKVIERYEIIRKTDGRIIRHGLIKECVYCHKIKKEEIEV